MDIKSNISELRKNIPEAVQLVCVSKFHSQESIMAAYEAGERDFGESRVQELVVKEANLPKDIRWHFIGPLQTNKIKQIVSFVSLIHSVENFRQIDEIQKQASKIDKTVNVLFEVHISQEVQKHGFAEEEIKEIFSSNILAQYPNINVCGLMGIASLTDDIEQIRQEFMSIKKLFDELRQTNHTLKHLSIGMSDDYPLAIEEGGNMIRIGSRIFGARIYN